MGFLQDILKGQLGKLGGTKSEASKKQDTSSPLDGVLDSVDSAVKSKLGNSPMADMAESALDQNKDGRIADDLMNMGGKLFKKK